ncbi:MAG: sodium:solute symporter family protein [Elusimicrobiota bacterium]
MHLIDVLIIGAFIAYAVYSGFRAKDAASQNLEEYFLAGRSLSGWKAGISMAATQFAADTPLLVTGLIATAGIFSLWRLWIYALAFLLMGFVLAASWRRAGVLTDAELTEFRYGKAPAAVLRGFKAIYLGTIFNCTVLAMVLLAATRIAEPFLLWNEWLPAAVFDPMVSLVRSLGVPLTVFAGESAEVWVRSANNLISIGAIVLVTTFYSTTGGLRSVVNTDVVQFGLAMVATACYAGIVVYAAGGFGSLQARIAEMFANGGPEGITPTQILAFTPSQAKDATWAVLAVISIQWLAQMNADGTGYLAQRSMACRTDEDARKAAVIFTVAQIFFRSLLWLPIGLGLMVLFPPDLSLPFELMKAERESTFVRGIAEFLPVGVKGLMVTGMLAALASTVDTHLNWGSSYWTNDIYKRFVCQAWLKKEPSGRNLVWVARGANILILVIGLVIMTQLSSIQTAWTASLLLGAGLGVLLVLRWLWWRINAWGEIACILASMILAPILLMSTESESIRLILMAVGATASGILVSLWTGPEDMERLKKFYAQVKPFGFWKPVAEALGEDGDLPKKKLGRSLGAVALAAFSIFCLLTGIGSWFCGSPPPVWFPWRGLWIALLLVAGSALVPTWWRMGFHLEGPSAGARKA